jgi:hypothetical protein
MEYSYIPAPRPTLNGGLYTGEPFAKNAPYANIPVVPDTEHIIHYNLRSANPPPEAITQYPGTTRPGNNFQNMPGVAKLSDTHNLYCTYSPLPPMCYKQQGMSKYYYL